MGKFIDPAKQMVEEYLKDKKGDGNVVRQSIEENDRDGYKSVFSRVLNAEIEKVDPKVIIKLGDRASRAIRPECGWSA